MNSKLKLWQKHPTWEASEAAWESGSVDASQKHPLKQLKTLPQIPGITVDAAKNLKWKSLKWMLTQDHDRKIFKGFMHHPFKYGWAFLKSIFKKKPFIRDGDFFLYGVSSLDAFEALLTDPNSLLVLGFSYCHKPFECPSGRFSSECMHDAEHPVCRQCFIGKVMHASTDTQTIPLMIPTIHYIGGKIFDIVHQNPKKRILFLITACEMTLEMFGDWGNMVELQGLGVRLDGRICNTMKMFELSEQGIKPGLTVVLDGTKQKILELIRKRQKIA